MMKFVVLCCLVVAVASRAPVYFTPAGLPLASFGYPAHLQQPLYNYRGPLSLAPGQPANIVAADGRPLDTLDVNLDRSAHFVAKAIDGSRVLKKRSVTRLAVAPGILGYSAAVAAGNVGPAVVSPAGVATSIATNPVGLSVPLAHAYGFASPLVAGGLAVPTPIAAGPLAVSTPLVAGPVPVSAVGTPFVRNF